MRRRSLTGPLLLLVLGGLFLWNNLHPELPIWEMVSRFWPFLLIVWGLLRLAEALAWRHRGNAYSSFTGGEVALVVLICVAGAGFFEMHRVGFPFRGQHIDVFGEQFEYPVSASASAAGAVRVVFENPRGNLKVTGGDGQQVVVTGRQLVRAYNRGEADRGSQSAKVEIVTMGDRIVVRSNQERASGNLRISDDLEVTVPRGLAVEARGDGDYDISGVAGDVELNCGRADVRLAQVGGNVRLDVGRSGLIRGRDLKGSVNLEGRGEDVALENVAGQVTINGAYTGTLEFKNLAKPLQFEGTRDTELRVEAVPGRISMDLGDFTADNIVGPVRFMARSRDVRIENFTKSLEIETDRGDVQLQPSGSPLPKIEARSSSGTIELILPEKGVFQLQATAGRGDAVNDFGPAIQKETDGRSATLKGKVGDGPFMRLTTDRGTVSVRKAGEGPAQFRGPAIPQPPEPPQVPGPGRPGGRPRGPEGRKDGRGIGDSEIKL